MYSIANVLIGVQRMGHRCQPKIVLNNVCLERVNKEVSSPPFLVSQHIDCAKFTGPVSVSV